MHTLPDLPYAYDALSSVIDEKTMLIHHTKHHQTYVDKLNQALHDYEDLQTEPLETLLASLDDLPIEISTAVRNHGGGHANHSLFWQILSPTPTSPDKELTEVLTDTFGSIEEFKKAFETEALGRFGSGWAWLTYESGSLHVCSTANQDTPLMQGNVPLLGLDVWEHAYYLRYQSNRAEYVSAFWDIVNWPAVSDRLQAAKG